MSKICPRSYDKFTCLHCGHITYGSGGGTKEHCPLCVQSYIVKLQTKLEGMKMEVCESEQKTKDCYKVLKIHRESFKNLQAKLDEKIAKITELERIVVAAKESVKASQEQLEEVRNQWHIDKNDKVALEAELEETKETLKHQVKCLSNCQIAREKLQAELERWKNQANLAIRNGLARVGELTILEAKYDELNGNTSGKILGLQAALETMTTDRDNHRRWLLERIGKYEYSNISKEASDEVQS